MPARSAGSTLAEVSEAMYERRSLVRWMAMRRTLFLLRRDDVPLVQAAISTPLAATRRNGWPASSSATAANRPSTATPDAGRPAWKIASNARSRHAAPPPARS